MSTAHINDLAAEILSGIFELRQEDVVDDGCALLDLASVCKYWNKTAFGHPQLWTSLTCSLGSEHSQALANRLERWFGRAGELPTTLHLVFSRWPKQESPVAEFIAGCSGWETLRFSDHRTHPTVVHRTDGWYWISQILRAGEAKSKRLGAACWPLLKNLDLNSPTAQVYPGGFPPLPSRTSAPVVKNLTMNYQGVRPYEVDLVANLQEDFAWSSISSLCVSNGADSYTAEVLSLILQHAQNLERMEIRSHMGVTLPAFQFNTPAHGTNRLSTPLKLQHLSLELDEYTLQHFFQNVRFPALRFMQLRTRGQPRLYSRFIKWSLEEQCRDPAFWPRLDHFRLILGENVLNLRDGDAGFPILKSGPWTWWILAGTPFGTP